MSKLIRAFLLFFPVITAILPLFNTTYGQDIRIDVRIRPNEPPIAEVSGRFAVSANEKSRRNLSFLRSVAGTDDLGSRVSEVSLFGAGGAQVNFKKLIDGEYLADEPFASWRYRINLSPAKARAAAAHSSWIAGETGILMLDDLLPQTLGGGVKVQLGMPDGWKRFIPDSGISSNVLSGPTVQKLVIPVGTTWREAKIDAGNFNLRLRISGEWLFSDEEAAAMAGEIYREYRKIFGAEPATDVQIVIAKFPTASSPGNWEAETRGRTVTIISGDMNFRTQSLQRLHEQLRHELFHLWLPNGVTLTGNYDWFYEGFALYQSLKSAVLLNRIRFDDFRDTLSRAYDIDNSQTRRLSLIEASQNRWSGADTQVYSRGLIVAFLCDIVLLDKSGGRRSAENLVREIYQGHRPPAAETDGNSAVMAVMSKYPELVPVIDKYVKGSVTVGWAAELNLAGIEASGDGRHISLKVREKPTGRQKALLDKLGYNNWRKLSGSSK